MLSTTQANVIAAANDAVSLQAAQQLKAGDGVDLVELRLDAFYPNLEALDDALPQISLPLLITARHPEEGGCNNLDTADRHELLSRYLPKAVAMDLELRSSIEMPDLISRARHLDKHVVLSFHDFGGTPRVELLEELAQEALTRGAHIFKAALTTNDMQALIRVLRFAEKSLRLLPTAAMGMGQYGMVSRLLLAQAGSVLNYTSLGGDTVPGQWEAHSFVERLREIRVR